jgi:hypothetical protein
MFSVLYKMFLNEIFGECLSNVNSFIKSYYMLDLLCITRSFVF